MLQRKISPGFFNHKSLSCITGWSSLLHSSPSFSVVEIGEGRNLIRLLQFVTFQGLQDCLSKTVTLLLWELPLELQSHHILSLLLVVRMGFFSFFLFLSFLFHTLLPSTFTMQWESQGNEEDAARLCPFHTEKGLCLSYVCYGSIPTKKPKKHVFRHSKLTSKVNFY